MAREPSMDLRLFEAFDLNDLARRRLASDDDDLVSGESESIGDYLRDRGVGSSFGRGGPDADLEGASHPANDFVARRPRDHLDGKSQQVRRFLPLCNNILPIVALDSTLPYLPRNRPSG